MTEDDTFRFLKRLTFDEVEYKLSILHQELGKTNVSSWYKGAEKLLSECGWTVDEYTSILEGEYLITDTHYLKYKAQLAARWNGAYDYG